MKRSEATRRIAELLRRVSEGGDLYLDAVEEVSVFGSYVAGAFAPNDIDLSVGFRDGSGEIAEEQIQRMFAGRNAETPFLQALRGSQRGMNIILNAREQLERQGGFEFIALWRRGDSIDVALERLHAIRSDPDAGTAPREHVHPAIAGFEKNTLIEARIRLIELDQEGKVRIRRLDIDRNREPRDDELRRQAGWGYSASSPRWHATRALLAYLEAEGLSMEGSDRGILFSYDLPDRPFATVQHGAERLGAALDDATGRLAGRSYCVLNLTGGALFAVLELEAPESAA
jgi:hypothetical protein